MLQKPFFSGKTALVIAACAAIAPAALHAQSTLYWDRNDSAAGPGISPLGSYWGAVANWNTSPLGTAATTGWVNGSNAVFTATNSGVETYPGFLVQLLRPITLNSLTYNSGETNALLVLIGSSPSQVINLASVGAFNISVDNDTEVRILAPLTGNGYLVKQGGGTLSLVGQQNYLGTGGLGTIVEGGKLILIGSAANPLLSSTAVVHVNADTTVGEVGGGTANLRISNGALLSDRNAYIGNTAGSNAFAQVIGSANGVESLWQNNGTVTIGGNGGTAEVQAENQGTLAATNIVIDDQGALTSKNSGIIQANTITVNQGGFLVLENGGIAQVDTIHLGNNGTLQLNADQMISGLTDPTGHGEIVGEGGNLLVRGTADIVIDSAIRLTTEGFGGLRVQHKDNSNLILNGLISGAGDIDFRDNLLGRTFTPTTTITRANTYSGLTQIRNGALVVTNTTGSATGTGNVEISGSLSGTGRIAGDVNLVGTIAPGLSGVGTLTLGLLDLVGNANFDLGTPGIVGGTTNDLVNVTSNLSISGTLNVNDLSGFGEGTYRLFNYGGTLGFFSLSTAGILPGGYFYTVDSSTLGQVNLLVTRRATGTVDPASGTGDSWDGTGTTANANIGGGSGLWDNTTTNWTNSFGSSNGTWGGKSAVFAAASGTVRLNNHIVFEGIEFTTNNYQILANGSFELRPTGQAILTTTSADVTSALIAAPITGSGGLIKQGSGTISLSGTNTYTGGTTLEAGTLDLWAVQRTAGVGQHSFDITAIGDAPLRIRGGVLRFAPNASDLETGNGQQGNEYHLKNNLIVENNFTFKFLDSERTRLINGVPAGGKAFFRYYLDGKLDLAGGNRFIAFDTDTRFPIFETSFVDINEITNGTGLTLGSARPEVINSAASYSHIVYFRGPGSNSYTGTTTVEKGVALALLRENSIANIPGDLVVNQGGAIYSYNEQIPDEAKVTINSTAIVFSQRNTLINETFGSLYGTGNLRIDRDFYGLNIGNITFGGGDFSGTLYDDLLGNTTDFDQNGITKISNNTFTLSGRGEYNGPTLIQGGAFIVNGSLTSPQGGQSPVTVSADARLSGTGIVSGAVTIANGGTLAPGNSPGTLTLGSLLLNPGSALDFELAAPGTIGGGVNDLLSITGDVRLDGFLNVINLTGFDTGSYRLINYGGALTNNGLELGSVPGPFSYGIDISTPNQVNLIVNAGIVQYWDGANNAVNGTVDGGTSAWNTTSTNWTNASGTTNSLWDGNSAIFTGAAGTVTVGENISAKEIRFLSSAYTISVESPFGAIALTIDGVGVVNNSGITQNFQTSANARRSNLEFIHQANAGVQTTYTNFGDQTGLLQFGTTTFRDSSSAGSSTLINRGGDYISTNVSNGAIGGFGGKTNFEDASTAANSTIFNYAGTVGGEVIDNGIILVGGGASSGGTTFSGTATASHATITNFGGTELNVTGGITTFFDNSTAANSIITNQGAGAANSGRGVTNFNGNSTAADATLIAESGTNGGLGGRVEFSSNASGGNSRTVAQAGAVFDFTFLSGAGTTFGSIEGAGTYELAGKTLTVGSLNTSTEVSGSLHDFGVGGGLTKVGTGTFTLSGTSNYNGATTLSTGKLLVNGVLGNTAVSVASAATLGGSGRIGGGVTVQGGGILSPGNSPGTLRVASLALNATSVLQYDLNIANSVGNSANDLVTVDGNLTLDGLLNVTSSGSFSQGTYRLFNYGGSLVNNGLTIQSLPTGFNAGDFVIQTDIAGQVNLALGAGGPVDPPIPTGFQFWDGANNLANGAINGGRGEWRISETNWTNKDGNVNGPWAGETAVFSATPGVVALAEDIPFQQLIFTVDGYQITAGEGFTLQPNDKARIDVAAQSRVEVAAPFSGRSSLTKTGEGTLLLSAQKLSTLTSLAVEEGSVYLNAWLQAKSVTVAPDALLGGSGLATAKVENNGSLAPGNSVGTLSIDGDYTQGATGDFALEVGSLTAFDRLFVSGTAQLEGTLRGIESGHHFTYGEQFPFLYAGKISGRFDTIDLPDPEHLRGRFLVENGIGTLLVAPRSYTQVAVTPNEKNLADALDRWIGIETGDISEVTLALDLLREQQYSAVFESLLPSFYEAALNTSVELSQNHLQLLQQQLSARRLGARLPKVQTQPVSDKDSKDKVPVEVESPERWNSWVQGSGLYASDGLSQISGDDFQSGTVLLGADYAVNEHFAGGLFASYQAGWSNYQNDSKLDLETTRFGLYGTADYGPLYVNAAVGVGTTDYKIRRDIPLLNRRASAHPDGSEFFAELGTGYDFTCQNWTFGPQIALQYSGVKLDNFTETGAGSLNLRLADASTESLRSQIGGRLAYSWQITPTLTAIPELRVFWQHEYLQNGEDLTASLAGGKGADFVYQTQSGEKDSVFLGAGVGFQINSQIYANLYYNADFGRSDATNHTLSISVNLRF